MDLKKYKLGDVGKIITGKTPPTNNSNNYGGEIPFLTPSDDLSTVYVESTAKMLSNLGVRSVKKCLLPPRSVCVSCIGSDLGRVILTKVETVTNQQFNAIIPHSEFNSEYLYYYLTSLEKYFKELSASSTSVPIINKSQFSQIEISLPKLSEQEVIAQCLSVIDRKIALNREINRNLEAMARQLYDYWFVQFDFPDDNGKPYKSSGGKMVWNEKLKRDIPEGWNDGQLIDIANITMGQSPDGSTYNEIGDGALFYQGSTDFGMRFPSVRQFTTAPTRFAKQGDILMSVRAPVGTTNIANAHCCIGRGLAALNSKIGSITHLYHIIQDLKTAFDMRNDAGTTFGSITKDDLYRLAILKPDASVVLHYEKLCSQIFAKQMLIGENIDVLTKQRDELLPLLMNGQVSLCSQR